MASLFMRFPGGKDKTLTLSYDDGVIQDIKFLALLKKYNIKCTFNLNSGIWSETEHTEEEARTSHRRLTEANAIKLFKDSGFEVATHGVTHPFLEQLPTSICIKEIIEDREALERQFGGIIRGHAYPFGTYNEKVVESLRQCGIAYARTVHSTRSFDIPDNWLILNPTCHHDDPELMNLLDSFLNTKVTRGGKMFYLWGHSYEFDFHNNWEVIEEFVEKAAGHEDVWYATNIEIVDYVEAYRSLKFAVDMKSVFNPSSKEIWFEYDNRLVSVLPGETKKF